MSQRDDVIKNSKIEIIEGRLDGRLDGNTPNSRDTGSKTSKVNQKGKLTISSFNDNKVHSHN